MTVAQPPLLDSQREIRFDRIARDRRAHHVVTALEQSGALDRGPLVGPQVVRHPVGRNAERARPVTTCVPARRAARLDPTHHRQETALLQREMLSGKIDRATVTRADPRVTGSVVIDVALMEAADILESEQVVIVDVATGGRTSDYAVAGPRGSGVIAVTGAAARMVQPGDTVTIMTSARVPDAECHRHEPQIVFVDGTNRIVAVGTDPAQVVPLKRIGA